MSAVDVLAWLDSLHSTTESGAITNHKWPEAQEARAAVAELIPDARAAARSVSAAATALEACKAFVPSEEWKRLQLDAFLCQLHSDAKSLRAALAQVQP